MTGVDETVSTVRSVKKRSAMAVAVVAAAMIFSGCAKDAPQDIFKPQGEDARKINDLQLPVFILAGVVGVIVFAVIAYVLFRFRDHGQEMPRQTHGKPALEIGLTTTPAALLIGRRVSTIRNGFSL